MPRAEQRGAGSVRAYFEQLGHDGEAAIGRQPLGDGAGGRDEDAVDGVDVTVAGVLLPAYDGGALHCGAHRHRVEKWHLGVWK